MQIFYIVMTNKTKTTFLQVAFTHFVPCFFLGTISLFLLQGIFPQNIFELLINSKTSGIDIAIASANGLFVAVCTILFHWRHNRRVRKKIAWINQPVSQKKMRYGALVGFMSGAFNILFGLHNIGIIVLTLFVLLILICHLRIFARDMVGILKPGNITTWTEVAELLRIYLNMLAGFTLINASLEVAHLLIGIPPPFGFGADQGQLFIDALYYTVVTMTTLGYGDIVPKSWDGKLLLIFQCLVSYVMFALMVGIITRGVIKEDSTLSKSDD
jgi:voltage-gated potassium channel